MVARLRDDAALLDWIAKMRGWKPETLRQLALELYLGLGRRKEGYRFYLRYWPQAPVAGEGRARYPLAFGKPWLWRGAYLTFAQTVYVTEGETDAIALIDAGIETDPGTIAVAIPSASTFNEEWVQLFRSKDVVLAFDADDAGQGATLKVSKLLLPFVRSLKANQMGGTTTCLLVPPKTSAIFIKVSGARTWFER